ncbi:MULTISPECIES: mannose-1-phosphate guanylyltransferase/mannose-6-phosphate isomerase [Acetobacter]|uniref:mannose-1-phosphate guanylyltransferase n=2 Tax=Acetobacter TaxID=434 RepID=A0AAN1PGV0_9PROT|nr:MULTISPECIES: mannose-1-phosphate guanylyltransferase/mannose-6-phosphate isomerase [Acetobacter]ASL40675.1 mannose-1-phosphate guanylyltransferase/mannose-6-phosphate isomerase [Acetobacter oryzifermentans]AXM99982.1 mannose-1-phosphate guanylyltransferase/mannose-6-phosphate isomerase [Acetobacter pomorum]KAA8392765.1 mannose-1-phosphate guanylyltransferase/mannose-6-phosphate isomerase [Acetobacter sp. DmW_125124]KAA8393823.1 mannose-1-phosphate guanylyltransferase/mannose-6-phosphate iso
MSSQSAIINSASSTVVPVILSGGSGSRLWPVSRSSFPKQFWPLLSDQTLLQETAMRGVNAHLGSPVVICNEAHRFIVAEQLREIGITDSHILLEPVARNSAPAIAAAAFLVAEKNPDAILWIMAADAAIQDQELLKKALNSAVQAASEGYITTFGMRPTKPETGYGYIERGTQLKSVEGAYHIQQFIEKPDAARAEELVKDERYSWNSGMFIAKASVLLREIETFEPKIFSHVKEAVRNRVSDRDFERLAPAAFKECPDISIDYAVAERTKVAAVVPASFGWSDIGSWDAVWEITPKDAEGNATFGDVFLDDSKNCYVRSDGIVTTVTGVKDLIVVVTSDAVMVAHRDRAQDVKKIVTRLKEAGRPEATQHNRMYRPWGFYESLIEGDRFQVKRIHVEPGQKLSLQKHFHRAEHWVVVAGTAIVTRDKDEILVRENESVYLPLGAIHRLANPGKIPLTLIEVQSGPYLGEDDIVRLEDVYARS